MQNSLFNPQISPVTTSAYEVCEDRTVSPDIDAFKETPCDLTTVEQLIEQLATQSEFVNQSF